MAETPEELQKNLEEKMNKAIHSLEKDFSKLRTGRANTKILDDIKIDYYGSPTSITQIANISVPEANLIIISPWDKKMVSPIEKAILMANIGIFPQNNGDLLRLPIPPLSQERRKELVKIAKKFTEEIRIAIRNIRRDAMTQLKKMETDKLISQDDQKRKMEEVEKKTSEFISKADKLTEKKEHDLMED